MKITFVKSGSKYFISIDDTIMPYSEENLAKVNSRLSLPATVYFHNCPFDFIGSLVVKLFDETTDIHIVRIDRKDNSLDYEANFTKVKELPGMGLK
jgi:hypothetical protein